MLAICCGASFTPPGSFRLYDILHKFFKTSANFFLNYRMPRKLRSDPRRTVLLNNRCSLFPIGFECFFYHTRRRLLMKEEATAAFIFDICALDLQFTSFLVGNLEMKPFVIAQHVRAAPKQTITAAVFYCSVSGMFTFFCAYFLLCSSFVLSTADWTK